MSGELHFRSSIDNSQFLKAIDQMKINIHEVADQSIKEGQLIDDLTRKLTNTAAAFGIGFSAVGIIKEIVRVRGEFQQLESSFKTLLGSEEKADDLMQQLVKTAATTPFDLQGVAQGAKQLLAYGTSADVVNDKLIELGNIAAGLSLPLNDLVTLYGTTVSKDAMDTLDLKQFKSRGIAIDEAIAEVMKVSKEEVPALITAHKVTGDIVAAAVADLAGEGGKFGGMMLNQSKTIAGQISNIGDAVDSMFNEIGKKNEGLISDVLSGVSYIVENYELVGLEIAKAAAAYGAYKAVLMSLTAYQEAALKGEEEMLRRILEPKEAELDADLKELVTKNKITEERAREVLALRKEAAARIEALKIKQQEATVEAQNALLAKQTAILKHQAAEQQLAIARSQLSIALQKGNAEEIANARVAVSTAYQNVNTTAITRNNAVKASAIASTNAIAASTALATAQTQMQTAAMVKGSRMTTLFANAQKALSAVMKATGLSMLANPYVAAAAAVAGLTYAIVKLVTAESEEEKVLKRLNEIKGEEDKKASKELVSLLRQEEAISKLDKTTQDYAEQRSKMMEQIKPYINLKQEEFDALVEEGRLYDVLQEKVLSYYNSKARAQAEDELNTAQADANSAALKKFGSLYDEELKKVTDPKKIKEYEDAYANLQKAVLSGKLKFERGAGEDFASSFIGVDTETMDTISRLFGVNGKSDGNGQGAGASWIVTLAREVQNAVKARQDAQRQIDLIYGKPDESKGANKQTSPITKETESLAEDVITYEELVKKIEKTSKELEVARQNLKEGKTHKDAMGRTVSYEGDVDALEQQLKDQKELLKKMGIEEEKAVTKDQKNRLKEALNNELELRQRLNEQVVTQVRELERQKAQATIDAMSEGLEKTEAQRKLNLLKELDRIEAQGEAQKNAIIEAQRQSFEAAEEVKAAKQGESYVKSFFDAAAAYANMEGSEAFEQIDRLTQDNFDNAIAKSNKESEENNKKALSQQEDFWNKYLSLQINYQQRLKDINEQAATGFIGKDDAEVLKRIAQEELNTKLTANGYDAASLSNAFIDFSSAAESIVEGKISDLIRMYEEALAQMDEEAKQSEQGLKMRAALNTLRDSVKDVKKANPQRNDIKAWNQYESAIGGCIDAGNELASTIGNSNDETLKQVTEVAQATLSLVGNVVQFTTVSIKAIQDAETAGVAAVKAVEAASVILLIISTVIQIGQMIADLMSQSDKLEQKYKDDIADFNERVSKLKRNMMLDEDLNDTIFGSSIWEDAVKNGKVANEKLANVVETTKKLLLSRQYASNWNTGGGQIGWGLLGFGSAFGEKNGKFKRNTLADVTGIDINEIKDAESAFNALGKSIGEMVIQTQHSTWFRSAKYKSIKELNPDLYNSDGSINMDALKEFTSTDTYDSLATEQKNYIKDMVDAWEDYQKAMEQLDENLSNIFGDIGNVLGDAIENAFLRGESAADEFATSVGDMMNSMIKDMIVSMRFGKILEDAEKDLKSTFTADMSENDRMQRQIEIMSGMVDAYQATEELAVKDYANWVQVMTDKGLKTSAMLEQEELKYGGYETMSEETGTELSGRFSAMYIVQSEHLEVARQMLDNLQISNASITGSLDNLVNMHGQTNMILNEINAAARLMAEASQSLPNIEKYTKNLQ